jgi:hypothetical protein
MRFSHIAVIFILAACSERQQDETLFTDVTAGSGITFRNKLTFTERLNPYTYRNFYNGAGVAVGDINNDGLHDIYFAANQAGNRLYLNKGNFAFEDITAKAGVAEAGAWSSGVTFVDINADGLLDIYVCKSGDPESVNRSNALFINNGDLTFSERAAEYGLDVKAMSVQAAFFDYDRDGDLDCYLLSNSMRAVGGYDLVIDQRNIPDPQGGGNKFFRNDNGMFVDFSEKAGIYRSNIGFGLGITLGDFNEDSWTDIFISNDFFERDYLYINNRDGTFRESLAQSFESISMGSMGADFADLDGDGNAELFVTEMLPDSLRRKKTKTVYESWDKYSLNVEKGYHFQVPRNVLHKRVGPGTYVEVGRLAGVSASEWSWGALLFDMDNDGRRDIFIANGIMRDLLDRDYLAYTATDENVRRLIQNEKNPIVKLIELMPSSAVSNYAYRNQGNLSFADHAQQWGLAQLVFSTGSAYADFDNDGDLDLVVNNQDTLASLFRNNSDTARAKSLCVTLSQPGNNSMAISANVAIFFSGKSDQADNFVTRGFQSAVSTEMHFGLGEYVSKVDSVLITWPDGKYTTVYDIPANSDLTIDRSKVEVSERGPVRPPLKKLPFSLDRVSSGSFRHRASNFVDFNRDRLLPMMYSNETPALLKGDLDGDGTEDIYVGGGKDQNGAVVRVKAGVWSASTPAGLKGLTMQEETKGALFDADGDGDLDLYMSSGGRFYPASSSVLMDKIFINDGRGDFKESADRLPFLKNVSTSFAQPIDFDRDGDLDLIIGERFDPFIYGFGGRAFLLENDGKAKFTDVTKSRAPQLMEIGMLTDAVVTDFDTDGWEDIVLVGDWMPIKAFRNAGGNFRDDSGRFGWEGTEGWWRDVEAADLNDDGKPDFVVSNHGRNTFFKPGDRMYVGDFDRNGSIEQIFCTKVDGKYYPVNDRDEFLSQLPGMKKTLLYYGDYATKSIDDLFPAELLQKVKMFEVKLLSSSLWLSGPEAYVHAELPLEAQYSPIYALMIDDLDGDGVMDLVAGGNQYQVKPQFGRYDASHGWFFKGLLQNGTFSLMNGIDMNVKGQIRDIESIDVDGDKYILFARYGDDLEIMKVIK